MDGSFLACSPREIAGRGIGVVADRAIEAGSIVCSAGPAAVVCFGDPGVCSFCLKRCSGAGLLQPCRHCSAVRICQGCHGMRFYRKIHEVECVALQQLFAPGSRFGLRYSRRRDQEASSSLRLLVRLAALRSVVAMSRGGDGDEDDDDNDGEQLRQVFAAVGGLSNGQAEEYDDEEYLDEEEEEEQQQQQVSSIEEAVGIAQQCRSLLPGAARLHLEDMLELVLVVRVNAHEVPALHPELAALAADPVARAKRIPVPSFTSNVGLGLFPSAARFNHSCSSNCLFRLADATTAVARGGGAADPATAATGTASSAEAVVGSRMLVTTTRAVEPGEELCITYIDPLPRRRTRQRLLQESFGFLCACDRCQREENEEQEVEQEVEAAAATRATAPEDVQLPLQDQHEIKEEEEEEKEEEETRRLRRILRDGTLRQVSTALARSRLPVSSLTLVEGHAEAAERLLGAGRSAAAAEHARAVLAAHYARLDSDAFMRAAKAWAVLGRACRVLGGPGHQDEAAKAESREQRCIALCVGRDLVR